jgi:AAA+ superfamily predicted ATPase
MKDNGLLSIGDLYEVGRADLVGKYVGWTAQIVKEKFRAAQGSVLFIDEAYSLVEDRDGMFGDEAINTIVQEMENRREDMVVIFAGYPDKMESFVQKNPGLRSRIAFTVPFADYNPDELYKIAELLAEAKSITFATDVKDKLLPVFTSVMKNDDFGNGRFARNLLEKAQMKHASRLISMDVEAVSKEDVCRLTAEDFDIPTLLPSTKKRVIGFTNI